MGRSALPAVVLVLAAGISLAGIPRDSATRGARMQNWKASIEFAREAQAQGAHAEAEKLYREVIRDAESSGDGRLLLARAVDGLGDLMLESGRLAEAIRSYQRSAELWEALLGGDQPRLAVTLHNLGRAYTAQNKPQLARPVLQRSLDIWETTYGPDSSEARNTRRALQKATTWQQPAATR